MISRILTNILRCLVLPALTLISLVAAGQEVGSDSFKVLILGNSITYHGAKPSIGWSGNWGMAASKAEKDYVHILQSRIKQARPGSLFKYGNIAATFERQFWKYNPQDFKSYQTFGANLIILVIGDNINKALAVRLGLGSQLEQFVKELSSRENLEVFLVGSFWPNREVNHIMKATAEKNNWLYVDLGGLYDEKDKNTAVNQFQDKEIGMHPSDQGMEGIAQRIWDKSKNKFIN